jgi:acyl carrier protein
MTFEQFRIVVSEVAKVPLDQVQEETSIRDELALDSLQLVNLIMEMIHRFGIELGAIGSMEDIRTVGLLFRHLRKGE